MLKEPGGNGVPFPPGIRHKDLFPKFFQVSLPELCPGTAEDGADIPDGPTVFPCKVLGGVVAAVGVQQQGQLFVRDKAPILEEGMLVIAEHILRQLLGERDNTAVFTMQIA